MATTQADPIFSTILAAAAWIILPACRKAYNTYTQRPVQTWIQHIAKPRATNTYNYLKPRMEGALIGLLTTIIAMGTVDHHYIPKKTRSTWLVALGNCLTTITNLGSKMVTQLDMTISHWRTKRRHKTLLKNIKQQTSTRRHTTKVAKLMAIATVFACAATNTSAQRITRFDTDSAKVGIDNRCSACMSHV